MSRKVLAARFGKKVGAIQQMRNKTEKRNHRKQREAEIGPKVIDPRITDANAQVTIEKSIADRIIPVGEMEDMSNIAFNSNDDFLNRI